MSNAPIATGGSSSSVGNKVEIYNSYGEIERLEAEKRNLTQIINELNDQSRKELVEELSKAKEEIRQFKEDKIRVDERERLLGEREKNLAQREAVFAETLRLSEEQDEKSHIAKIAAARAEKAAAKSNMEAAEAKEKAAEEDQTRTLKLHSTVKELRLEVTYEKKGREEQIQKNIILESEKKTLLGTIEELGVEIAAAKRQDSRLFTEPVIPSKEEDEKEKQRLQDQVDECQAKLLTCTEAVESSELTLKNRKRNREVHPKLPIDVEGADQLHKEAVQKQKDCEAELQGYQTALNTFTLNQERQPRHSSIVSTTSTSADSQGSTLSRVSTAPTEWSCDSCGPVLGWKSSQVTDIVMAFHRTQQVVGGRPDVT